MKETLPSVGCKWRCGKMNLINKTVVAIIIFFTIFKVKRTLCNKANAHKHPSVLIVILARNKAHTLPNFLSQFENLNYPKQRLALFIRSDHNIDKTNLILDDWLNLNKKFYHSVDVHLDKNGPKKYSDEEIPTDWTDQRFDHLIALKEAAFTKALKMWADYVWFLDSDVIITNMDLLSIMINKNKTLIAPMLNSLGTYSNYWCGMTEEYWYKRTDQYLPILERKEKGCFSVPMIHSSVLINLNILATEKLTFNPDKLLDYNGPVDDIITFAISAKKANIDMFVCNEEIYGYIPPPLNDNEDLSKDFLQMIGIRLEILVYFPPVKVVQALQKYSMPFPKKDKLGFDKVYLINLLRRSERKIRMYHSFDELGLNVKFTEAVDGSKLNDSYLETIGIKQLQDYKDPWAKRDMTYGEIGCFLSHYNIWKDVVENQYDKVSKIQKLFCRNRVLLQFIYKKY